MATDSLMIMSRLDEQWKEIRPSDVDVSEKFAEIKLPAGRLPSHFAIVDREATTVEERRARDGRGVRVCRERVLREANGSSGRVASCTAVADNRRGSAVWSSAG